MAILSILHYPDPRLRNKSTSIARVDDAIRKLVDDMLETMYQAPGIGLAAPQVNVHKRLIVIDISENRNAPLCLINPEIVHKDGIETMEEGCLSVPGIFEPVERAQRIRVKALGRDGKPLDMEMDDVMAVCIQHEIDHLEGKLFVDYLSEMKRQRIRKKLEKQRRQTL